MSASPPGWSDSDRSRRSFSIKDWPARERPREKLRMSGAASLSEGELLAILIRTGTRGLTALDLARRVLGSVDSLLDVSRMSVSDLVRLGVGLDRATAVAAAFELGRRIPGPGSWGPRCDPLATGRGGEAWPQAPRSEAGGILGAPPDLRRGGSQRGTDHRRDVELLARPSEGMLPSGCEGNGRQRHLCSQPSERESRAESRGLRRDASARGGRKDPRDSRAGSYYYCRTDFHELCRAGADLFGTFCDAVNLQRANHYGFFFELS